MMDWLKFFPFEWRDDHKPAEIRGPYFPKPRQNKWFLGDNTFYFAAPRANPIYGFSGRSDWVDGLSPGRKDILKAQWDRVYDTVSDAPPSEWDRRHFYSNTWKFVGPWFAGFQAELMASGLLFTAFENHSSFTGKNLFHPRVFEAAIASHLDRTYGYDRRGSKPRYRAPLNWRVLPISSSIQAVVYDVHHIGNGTKDNPTLNRLVCFPITPHFFIQICLNFGGTNVLNDKIKGQPLFDLCDAIINSMRLQVGDNTQAEWDKVKATCADMSITETFGELPWPLKVEKPSKKSSEVDITPRPKGLNN